MIVQQVLPLAPVVEIAAVVITASAGCAKLWLRLRRSVLTERSRTARLVEALRAVDSSRRVEVVRACAEFEAAIGQAHRRASKCRCSRDIAAPGSEWVLRFPPHGGHGSRYE